MSADSAAASPSAHASSVAAAGALVGSVFIKLAGARTRFAPVDIFVGDAVCHLAERASVKLAWCTTAGTEVARPRQTS